MSDRSDTPTEPPKICDQVPVPDGYTCERWRPTSEPFNTGMAPCKNDAAVLFVYEASQDPTDDRRRNCLACEDCAPLPIGEKTR